MSALDFISRRLLVVTLVSFPCLATATGCGDGASTSSNDASEAAETFDAGTPTTDARSGPDALDASRPSRDGGPGRDSRREPVDSTGWDLSVPEDTADTGPPPLALDQLSPDRGPTSGGTRFVLDGAGFTDQTKLYFGSREAEVELVRGQLVGETPQAPGPGSVTVKALDAETGRDALEEGFTYSPSLAVSSVEPNILPTRGGFQVTLQGSGFTEETRVSFDGKPALQHAFVDATTLRLVAPPHDPGSADLRITNRDESIRVPDAVTYTAPLDIEAVRPATGPPAGGTRVTVEGRGFESGTRFQFGGEPATAETVDEDGTSAVVETPAHATGLVDVSATSADGSTVVARDHFQYAASEAGLQLGAIHPQTGDESGGTEVTLIGTGIDATGLEVAFEGRLATVHSKGPGRAVVSTPAHAPGTVDVTVSVDGEQASRADAFSYVPELRVDTLQPTEGSTSGGDVVTVQGTGFDGTSRVELGGIAVSHTVVDDSTLELTTPPHASGRVDLVVERSDAETTLEEAFTYEEPLEVYGQSPSRGSIAGGTYVIVRGRGFTGESPTVTFDDEPAPESRRLDPNTLAVRTPPHAEAHVPVEVETDEATATSPHQFAYFNPANRDGGTSGGPIRGAVNVSVYAGGGAPLEDAFVMLSTRPQTDHQGRTDANGQVTFSGPNLEGAQTVTAAAPGYSTATIQQIDAENITLFLDQRGPIPDPPDPPADTGPEDELDAGPTPDIDPPDTSSDAGTPSRPDVDPPDPQPDATTDPPDPPPDPPDPGPPVFEGELTGLDKVSLPSSNRQELAIVYTTRRQLRMRNPAPGPDNRLHSDGHYRITTRVGDLALVAVGGLYDPETGDFEPHLMGVRRYQHASKGETYQRDIELDIELDRTLTFKVPDRPFHQHGPDTKHLQPYLDFGVEGVFGELPAASGDATLLDAERYPDLEGDLSNVTITVLGGAYTGAGRTSRGAPYSVIVDREIRQIDGPISVSPLLGVPILSTPRPDRRPRNDLIDFTLSGRHTPDFFRVLIYDSQGRTVLEAFMPGSASHIHLPEFPDMSSLPEYRRPEPYPPGRYFLRVTAARSDEVGYTNFSYTDLSIYEWPAYALNYYPIRL